MKNYLFKLERDYTFKPQTVDKLIDRRLNFYDLTQVLRLSVDIDGTITIYAGYAWDGCSPKWKFLDLWFLGTPDGAVDIRTGQPATYYASLVHDALGQFAKSTPADMPFTRRERDAIFRELLGDFALADLYHWFLRTFGECYDKMIG